MSDQRQTTTRIYSDHGNPLVEQITHVQTRGAIFAVNNNLDSIPCLRALVLGAVGGSLQSTADFFHLSVDGVKSQRINAYKRLGAGSMQHAVALAFENHTFEIVEPLEEMPLSGRELDILELIAAGLSQEDAASKLDLSALTVKSHQARITSKIDSKSAAHSVALAHLSKQLPR